MHKTLSLSEYPEVMSPDVGCEALHVGFIYVHNDINQHGFVCAVCRRVFFELTDFQQDFASHDVKTSTVTLPIKASWVHDIDKDCDLETAQHQVDIPLEAFVEYVNQYKRNDVIQTLSHIKSENYETIQNKQINGCEAELSDNEGPAPTSCDCPSSTDCIEAVKKVCFKSKSTF